MAEKAAPQQVSVRVRVPATSANLGPGFDSLGLALDLYAEAAVIIRPDDRVVIEISGIGADSLPRDERHLMLRSLRTAAARFGLEVSGIEISVVNAIPQGRGLGSSAATITAGVAAAWMLVPGHDQLDCSAVLEVAAAIEGHPDNVAACVHGGLAISWQSALGVKAVDLPVHPEIQPVLFLPSFAMSTAAARGLLPSTVPHADAAFTAGRSGLLVHALSMAPELLMDATEDRLHQTYRCAAMPQSAALLEGLRRSGIPAVISGAGPSVLALCGSESVARHSTRVSLPRQWTRHRLRVSAGVETFPLPASEA
ncbi:homoserine kinase [soil metagenome]